MNYFKPLFLFMAVFLSSVGCTQTALSEEEKTQLLVELDSLFEFDKQLTVNVASGDLKEDLTAKSSKGQKYNQAYLSAQLDSLQKNDSSGFVLGNIAEYYKNNGQTDRAQQFYALALKHFSVSELDGDTSQYLSYRGLFKANLGLEDARDDFKAALNLNSNDSIAIYFYSMILLNNGEIEQANEILIEAIESEQKKNKSVAYFMLFMTSMYDFMQNDFNAIIADQALQEKYAKKDYKAILDFKMLEKYAQQFPDDSQVQSTFTYAEIMSLFFKLIFFSESSGEFLKYEYNIKEQHKLKELEERVLELSVNAYSKQKFLGVVTFLQNDWTLALNHFEKALSLFPAELQSNDFNTNDVYQLLKFIYREQNDVTNLERIINAKIETNLSEAEVANEKWYLANHYYLQDNLELAEKHCNEARSNQSNHFEALRLLAQINFLKGSYLLADFYADLASKNIPNEYKLSVFLVQYAYYEIYRGKPITTSNFSTVQELCSRENPPLDCSVYEEFKKKYLK